MTPDVRLGDVKEVADMLGCGRTRVFQLLAEGHIAGVRIGRKRMVLLASVSDYIGRINEQENGA